RHPGTRAPSPWEAAPAQRGAFPSYAPHSRAPAVAAAPLSAGPVGPGRGTPRWARTPDSEAPMFYSTPAPARLEVQHTCAACGCVFRYRVASPDTDRPPLAVADQQAQFRRYPWLATQAHPCPHCGFYQAEMTLWYRLGHPLAFLIAFFALLAISGMSMGS